LVASPSASPSPSPLPIPAIPEGTYRATITRHDLLSHDSTEYRPIQINDPGGINENTGTIRLTFQGGHFTWHQTAEHTIFHPDFSGVYTGTGHVMKLIFDPNTAAEAVDTVSWKLRDGCLVFKVLSTIPEDVNKGHINTARGQYESHPWCPVD